MKLTDPHTFIVIGSDLRHLIGCRDTYPIGPPDGEYVLSCLSRLSSLLQEQRFRVSHALLQRRFDETRTTLETAYKENKDAQVGPHLAAEIARAALELENTVIAESATCIIGVFLPRRLELDLLLNHQEKLFSQGLFTSLPAIAQQDIKEACRCLAFESPTAAAFLLLRAIEACVRRLYKAYFRRGNERRAWGQLLTQLKGKPKQPKPNADLLNHLEQLRANFRNPTDHPDKLYKIDEAEELLLMAIDPISRCARDSRVRALPS
jgi:hypothetical protein